MALEKWHYNRNYERREYSGARERAADIKFHLEENPSSDNVKALALKYGISAGYIRNIKNGNNFATVMPECNCEEEN